MALATSLDVGPRFPKISSINPPDIVPLGRLPLLSGAPPAVLSSLTAMSVLRRVSRRGTLVPEGQAPSHVFVVLRGRLRAVRRSETGREVTLETMREGDVLADALLAPDRPLRCDWEAAEPVEVLAIAREDFMAQIQAWPTLAVNLGGQVASRLDRSKDMVVGLALADVPERVTGALRRLAESEGQTGPDGVLIPNRPTQQELANAIGACRETVSRIVSDLARRGLVTPRGRALLISRRLLGA
jgi:CRP/FNR family cyclic AMP-dependent transcriptional regulator